MSRSLQFRFRCDSGQQHGLGHLMRCLVISKELISRGHVCTFAINTPGENVKQRIIGGGCGIIELDGAVSGDNPYFWLDKSVDLSVVDSKEIDISYIRKCRDIAAVAYFDDELARDFECDAIINNHIWGPHSNYSLMDGRVLMLGTHFNTVNSEYFAMQSKSRQGLMISMGGEDPQNHTAWLIETLAKDLVDMSIHVCIGPAHPDPESVQKACERYCPVAKIYSAPSSLIEAISNCHLAFSAGGTTCYELAAAGVATAIIAVEDHQCRLQASLVNYGAAMSLGLGNKGNPQAARAALRKLMLDHGYAAGLVQAGSRLLPSSGVGKIADCLVQVATEARLKLGN